MKASSEYSSADRKGSVKTYVPRQLHRAIIRIQPDEDLDWEGAAAKAAVLIDANSKEFKQAVEREASKLSKSQFMSQLNTARETVRDNAFRQGQEWTRNNEDNFHVPCNICGKPMELSERNKNWESEIKPALYEAFGKWSHATCAKT